MTRTLDSMVGKTGQRTFFRSMAVVIGSSIALSACSKVPDAINPAAWYRSTSDFVSGEDSNGTQTANNDLQANRGNAPPGADGASPNLSRVDQQMAQRQNMSSGLTADTQGRKYAESVQRQGDSAQNSLYAEDKAPAAPQVEAQQAAPAPQPAKPVMTAKAPPAPTAATPQAAASSQQATQTSVASVSSGPDATYGVDPGMRDRLKQQLAEIQARAADQGSLLPSDMAYAGDGQSTVIISSDGVQTSMAPASMQFQNVGQGMPLSQLAAGPVSNNGALPLPPASTKVATILFNNGSAGLDANDRKILADVARLQRERNATVRVIGHASQRTRNMDPSVHKRANYQVSVQRANQVASELKKMGISSEKILTAAVGDNHPIYLEVMPSGEAGNRRTEIYLSN